MILVAKRGRPTNEEKSRRETKVAIIKALEQKGEQTKYNLDHVEEYMEYYDNLRVLNAELKKTFNTDVLKEKRQVTKEMRSILMYLGLKPSEEGGGTMDEEL